MQKKKYSNVQATKYFKNFDKNFASKLKLSFSSEKIRTKDF